jgi:hypothetical protein
VSIDPSGRAMSQYWRANDGPIQLAFFDRIFYGLMIGYYFAQYERSNEISEKIAELVAALPDPKRRKIDQAPRAVLFHRVHDIADPSHARRVRLPQCRRTERAERRILVG